ncbi:hypothetical protein NHL50_08515 [Acidimicrobiia bacterium EGI L10123]|uniref:hypothetical protein n=1 Tax=Salinilacustrithrix flava TaxID=2957203 RepID=UPI003D7C1952|nr:hypothetical protein [Acidimicrobiia bacterium EGI L10123]
MGRASNRKKQRRAEERWGTRRTESLAGHAVHWDPQGPAGREIDGALEAQHRAFVAKFGREPGPEDALLFDPDAETPQRMQLEKAETAMVEAMHAAGLDPAYIYAFQTTGVMPTEMNRHLLTDADLAEFEAAAKRYERLHSQ